MRVRSQSAHSAFDGHCRKRSRSSSSRTLLTRLRGRTQRTKHDALCNLLGTLARLSVCASNLLVLNSLNVRLRVYPMRGGAHTTSCMQVSWKCCLLLRPRCRQTHEPALVCGRTAAPAAETHQSFREMPITHRVARVRSGSNPSGRARSFGE